MLFHVVDTPLPRFKTPVSKPPAQAHETHEPSSKGRRGGDGVPVAGRKR